MIIISIDIGGGTFDASVIRYANGRYESLAPAMETEQVEFKKTTGEFFKRA